MGNRYFAIKFSPKWLKIENMGITEPAKANQVQYEKSGQICSKSRECKRPSKAKQTKQATLSNQIKQVKQINQVKQSKPAKQRN